MKIFGSEVCSVSWDVIQDGLAHMRGVTWRAVPAKFKTDVWDENLRVWGFVVCLWNVGSGLAHMRGVICSGLFRQSSKQGCVRWKFSDLKFVVCLGMLVQDGLAHMRGVTWRAAAAKFKTDVWDENLTVWGVVVYLWNVGSGLAHMRGVYNMASCSGKVQNTDVWDEHLGVWGFVVYLGTLVQGWHTCEV